VDIARSSSACGGFRALADREGTDVTRRSKHPSPLPLLRSAALCASHNMIAVSGQLGVSAGPDAPSGLCALNFDVDSNPVATNPLFSGSAMNSTIIPSYPVSDMTWSDVFNYDREGASVDVTVSDAPATSVPKPSTRWLCFATATLMLLMQYPRRVRGTRWRPSWASPTRPSRSSPKKSINTRTVTFVNGS